MKHFKLGLVLTFACSQSQSTNSTVNDNNRVTQNVNGTTVSYVIVTENTNSNSNQSKPSNK